MISREVPSMPILLSFSEYSDMSCRGLLVRKITVLSLLSKYFIVSTDPGTAESPIYTTPSRSIRKQSYKSTSLMIYPIGLMFIDTRELRCLVKVVC